MRWVSLTIFLLMLVALPLGQYTIDIAGKKQPFSIEEGKLVEFAE